jgi:hypothetical protein
MFPVIVLCASPERVRNILLAAEELNMIGSGEYVFFNVELLNRSVPLSITHELYILLSRSDVYIS